MPRAPYVPYPQTPLAAVTDARERLGAVADLLAVLHPHPHVHTPVTHAADRDEIYREALLALTRVITHVEQARSLESATAHASAIDRLLDLVRGVPSTVTVRVGGETRAGAVPEAPEPLGAVS